MEYYGFALVSYGSYKFQGEGKDSARIYSRFESFVRIIVRMDRFNVKETLSGLMFLCFLSILIDIIHNHTRVYPFIHVIQTKLSKKYFIRLLVAIIDYPSRIFVRIIVRVNRFNIEETLSGLMFHQILG